MMKRFIFSILFTFSLFCCYSQQIDQLQDEISKAEAEIARISSLLASNRDEQIESNTKIKLLEKRLKLRQSLVRQTSSKILSLAKTLRSYDSKVVFCGNSIDSLKLQYSHIVLALRDSLFLFPDEIEYNSALLSSISLSYSNYIDSLDNVISKTGVARSQVVSQKSELERLLSKRKSEVDQILKETKELDSFKKSLQQKESKLLTEMQSHRAKINQLQREIERLISIDNSDVGSESLNSLHTRAFKQAVGNLPSPLSVKSKIVDKYGTHDHPEIKGVKVSNKGVNLSFFGSSNVISIADGEVRGVYSIASLGSTVLIRHGEFISVYSNLNTVNVNKGDKVSAGQVIGRINGSGSEEQFFHFELWQEKSTLNPLLWIRF